MQLKTFFWKEKKKTLLDTCGHQYRAGLIGSDLCSYRLATQASWGF